MQLHYPHISEKEGEKMEAIVYSSNSGFTARYAKLLSEATGLPAVDVRRIRRKLRRGDDIVFLGWVMAGIVDNYMKMYGLYNVRVLCPVGLMPAGEQVMQTLHDRNMIPDEVALYYLRGGFDMRKIRGFKKIMAKSFRISMEMDYEDNETPESGEMYRLMRDGADFVDAAALAPVIEKIRELENSTEKELTTP